MAAAGWTWMAEVAGEELAKLEAAHPGRFAPLKAELERLVADPGLDAAAFPLVSPAPHAVATTTDDADNTPPSSQAAPSPADAVCTQGSSSTCLRSTSCHAPPSSVPCHCPIEQSSS